MNLVHRKWIHTDGDNYFRHLVSDIDNDYVHRKLHFRDSHYWLYMIQLLYNEHLDLDREWNLLGKRIQMNRLYLYIELLVHIYSVSNIHRYQHIEFVHCPRNPVDIGM